MPETKIGVSQFNKPAPLGYRRFQNAMIIFIIPTLVSLVDIFNWAPETSAKILKLLGYLPAIIKGFGVIIGNGQSYTPSNEQIEEQK